MSPPHPADANALSLSRLWRCMPTKFRFRRAEVNLWAVSSMVYILCLLPTYVYHSETGFKFVSRRLSL